MRATALLPVPLCSVLAACAILNPPTQIPVELVPPVTCIYDILRAQDGVGEMKVYRVRNFRGTLSAQIDYSYVDAAGVRQTTTASIFQARESSYAFTNQVDHVDTADPSWRQEKQIQAQCNAGLSWPDQILIGIPESRRARVVWPPGQPR